MQKQLINYTGTSNQIDIFNSNIIKTDSNPVQRLVIHPSSYEHSENKTTIYHYLITDSNLNGLNNICLSLTTPELRGKGGVRYPENFIYKAINKISIFLDDQIILSKTGEEFAHAYYNNVDNYSIDRDHLLGNTDLCKLKYGTHSDHIIFESREIYAPLKTAFDRYPSNVLRKYEKSILRFELHLNEFSNLLYYDACFYNSTMPNYEKIDLKPILIFDGYHIPSNTIKDKYVEQLIISKQELHTPRNIYKTSEFVSTSGLLCYTKTDNFENKKFICYPDFPISEEKLIKEYINRILSDIIVVSDKQPQDFIKQKGYPKESIFKEVKNNLVKLSNNCTCNVIITNVPVGYSVYMHTNILTFSRRHSVITYNISEKIKSITGVYIQESDDIIFYYDKINHDITLKDTSICTELWNSNKNTSTGDLRSNKSKAKDLIINDSFIHGFDLLSKDKGFTRITIKQGDNCTIIDTNENGLYNNHSDIDNLYSVSKLGKNVYQSTLVFRFNKNNYIFYEPSRMLANKENNFRSCQVHVYWKEFDNSDPRNLIKKTLITGVVTLHKLIYNDNKITLV